jgi:molybdopterin synthase catalytic subunit
MAAATYDLFSLSDDAISVEPPFVLHGKVGALVTFDGLVRDNNDGRMVRALSYSAYATVASSLGRTIVHEAVINYGLVDAACVHRVGSLAIGDVAVRVWAAAAHRQEAFAACCSIIDEIKRQVPIWKKETYDDDTHAWVGCAHMHAAAAAVDGRYG